eukprot:1194529-Prorocentrum_minimum.AAC.5
MAACKTEKELEQMFDPHSYRNFMMLGTNEVRKVHRGDLMRGRTLEAAGGCENVLMARLKNLLVKGVLFDTEVLKEFLLEHVGNLTFQEAFDRTGRVLNITGALAGAHVGNLTFQEAFDCTGRVLNITGRILRGARGR